MSAIVFVCDRDRSPDRAEATTLRQLAPRDPTQQSSRIIPPPLGEAPLREVISDNRSWQFASELLTINIVPTRSLRFARD